MTKALVISTKRSAWRDLMRSLDYARNDKRKGDTRKSIPFSVIPLGLEPKTYCLEGSCSIQLSYQTYA